MPENATDAICEWIDNDPTRRDNAITLVREEGLDYLRDYLIEEINEAQEPDLEAAEWRPHDQGPYSIRQQYSPRQILEANWLEIRDTLCPLPEQAKPSVLDAIRSAVGDWANPEPYGSAASWIIRVVEAYRDDRETILWSRTPQDTAEDYLPSLPGIPEQWAIWTELQLWRFEGDWAYSGFPFDKEKDWDHRTQTIKQSALELHHIEMRIKENISEIPQRVLGEIQSTIMSQLLQADLKAWEQS